MLINQFWCIHFVFFINIKNIVYLFYLKSKFEVRDKTIGSSNTSMVGVRAVAPVNKSPQGRFATTPTTTTTKTNSNSE